MPIKIKLMKNLKKEYGSKRGVDVYYGMETKAKKKNAPKKLKKIFN